MGKFAAVYDMPGGEQMLICVVSMKGQEPFFQVSTEIQCVQTSINMPVQMAKPESEFKEFSVDTIKKMGVEYLEQMPMENLMQLRRMMVKELKKQQSPTYLKEVEKK